MHCIIEHVNMLESPFIHRTLFAEGCPWTCRDRKSRHRSRSKEVRRRRHKSEVTDSSEDEFGGYVPRKRQEAPRASKIKPATATREPFRIRGCAAHAHTMHLPD